MQGKVLLERSASSVYVGVDVCKDHLDVFLHPLGKHLRVANGSDGLKRLRRTLATLDVALVTMEATGKYHRLAQRSLAQAGFAVAIVNPLRARLFAEAAGALAKTDRVDAKMLAILGEALEPQARPIASEALEALQELVRAHSAATAERTALINRLTASRTAFLKAELRRRLKSVEGHLKRLHTTIDKHIAADPLLARRREILVSIPGIGPTVAANLLTDLAELGSLDRRAIASLAGLAPFADDSAGTHGQRRVRGGRAHARRSLYCAALSAARHDRQLATFYRRLREAGKKPKVALTAVMRKLVVLANTLITENRLWQPIHA